MKKKAVTAKGVPIHCLHDKVVPASSIEFSKHHKREHPPEHVTKIGRILEANGWRSAVVISNLSGKLTKGRGRVLWAMEAGDTVPVTFQDYKCEADEVQDIIADNAAPEGSSDDLKGIADLITEFDAAPENFGFTDEQIEELMAGVEKDARPKRQKKTSGFSYKIAFDTEDQEKVWKSFLAKLATEMPGRESVAAQIIEFIASYAKT